MSYVQFDQREGTGVLTFSNPAARNALSRGAIEEVDRMLDRLIDDEDLLVLVLTGSGKAFIAGADIKEMSSMSPAEAADFSRRGNAMADRIEAFPRPVIAAVNGFALGGGLEIALAADFIYASAEARLGFPEAGFGIIPGFGGIKRLADRIGKAAAKELGFTGRIISADEAVAIGLVNKVCAGEDLLRVARQTAAEIKKSSGAAVKEMKELFNMTTDSTSAAMQDAEVERFEHLFSIPHQKEGMTAFIEKRTPTWSKRS